MKIITLNTWGGKLRKPLLDFVQNNQNKENNIKSTRTSHYTGKIKYADYIFVSKGLKIKDFKVLPDEVSDHSPIYLEI